MTAAARFSPRHVAAGLLLALLCGSGAVLAQTAADGTPWKRLSATQRSALAPLEREWSGLDAARQLKWLEIAERFPAMSPDERARMQQRMAEWAKLSPGKQRAWSHRVGSAKTGPTRLRRVAEVIDKLRDGTAGVLMVKKPRASA